MRTYDIKLHKGEDKYIELFVSSAIANNWTLGITGTPPGNGQALAYNSSSNALEWKTFGDSNASGTVTSVGLSLPTSLFNNGSPVTDDGSLSATFKSQTENQFFAAPSSGNGAPNFRAITLSDIPAIPTTKLTGVLPIALAPSGTNNNFYQLDADGAGGRIYWSSSANEFQFKNSDGTQYANARFNEIVFSGDATVIASERLDITANNIDLNVEKTSGTPTENAWLGVKRGSQPDARILWNESTNKYEAGVTGKLFAIARKNNGTFSSANLSGNTLTIVHNLGNENPQLIVRDSVGDEITFDYEPVNENTLTLNFSRVNLTSTWSWYAVG